MVAAPSPHWLAVTAARPTGTAVQGFESMELEPAAHRRRRPIDRRGDLANSETGLDQLFQALAFHARMMAPRPDGKYERMFPAQAPREAPTIRS